MKRLELVVIAVAMALFGLSSASAAPKHWLGQQRALVLLVEWKNAGARHSPSEVREVFFGQGSQSLREFFAENSAGAFDLSGDVREWRRSDKGWDGSASCDLDAIVDEAWRLFGRSVNIADYDTDGDGKIDNLFIVHSGRINSDRVGPDCAFTTSQHADHTVVFQSEGIGKIGDSIPIGFYLHEAGHGYFGLPDLYRDHYHGRYGIGMWGMMGLGAWGTTNQMRREDMFRYPSHFEPYSKVTIGWLQPREVRASTRRLELRPIETTGDLVAVPLANDTALYLEYRSATGFSKGHRGHGLLIWKNLELVQADGRDDLNHGHDLGTRPLPPNDENFGDDSDPFPGSLNVTSYENSGVRISNIAQLADHIELDIELSPALAGVQWQRPQAYGIADDFSGIIRLDARPLDF